MSIRGFASRLLSSVVLSVLLMGAAQVSANLSITTTKTYDGTGTCTLDPGQNNSQVCTNDEIRYNVAYQVTPPPTSQANVTITLTIPAAEPFRFSAGSPGLAACRNSPVIDTTGKIVTCVLRGLAPNPVNGPISTQAADISFDVLTSKDAQNGSVLTALQSRITSAENPTGSTSNGPGVTVIAQPQADLYKAYVGFFASQPRPAGCPSSETNGVTLRFRVGLNLANIKGHEALADGWTYTENLSGIAPNACIASVPNWNAVSGQTPWPPTGTQNPSGLNTGGGTYAFTQGNGVQTVTAGSGASAPNTSGDVVGSIDGNTRVVALHEVRVWVPLTEARGGADPCLFSGSNTIAGFDPNGRSGTTSNYGAGTEPTTNNTVAFGPINLCAGSFDKLFTANTKGQSQPLFNDPPRMANEVAGPNDFVDTYIVWNNNGVLDTRTSLCDKWDNRKMRLDLLDPALHRSGYAGTLGATSNYRFQSVPASGAMVADTSPAYTHIWGSSSGLTRGATNVNGEVEYGFVGGGNYADTNLRALTCNNGDSTLAAAATASGAGPVAPAVIGAIPASGWVTQTFLKANPSLAPYVNSVRMNDIVVPAGRLMQLFTHLQTLSADPFTGAIWADGTIIPNFGAFQSDSPSQNSVAPGTNTWRNTTRGFLGNDPLAVATTTGASCGEPAAGAYCDDAFTDRLRLATESVGIRKGILGSDPAGGPLTDSPVVPKTKGDIVTYQLWPVLTAKSAGVTIDNDLILVDTLPAGMRYVPGSVTFNGSLVPAGDVFVVDNSATFAASTITIRIPNQTAVAAGGAAIPAVQFDAEILLDDTANVANRQLINTVLIRACARGAAINPGTGAVTCNDQTATQTALERTARRTISLAATGALIVQKSVIGGAVKEIGSSFTMGLRYVNAGSTDVAEHRLIDILPYNGEPNRGNPDLAADATNFSGTRPLTNVVTPSATGYQVFYTTAAPGTIDVNPKCPSNTGAGPGSWPAFAPGVPPPAGCTGSAGSTTWVAATGGPTWTGFPAGATAVLIVDKNSFVNSTASRLVTMDFSTPGSRNADRYSNNVSAGHGGPGTALTDPANSSSGNGPGATFNTFSNNVTVRVVAASLSGTVFVDPDGDGATTGFESGTDTGLGGVRVTLRKDAATVGTAVTATAAITAGSFYNPATGGSSANPGPGLCPVPAGGLALGQYLFCDLVAGTDYSLVETQPAGYGTTGDRAGTGTPGGTVTSSTDTISGIGLTVGQNATGYDFGEATLTTVSGRVYVESNGNITDNGNATDFGLGGVSVALTCTPAFTGTTPVNTNSNGEYSFTGVAPGAACTITQTQPSPYTNAYATPGTSTTPGNEAGNTAGSASNGTISIVVPSTGSTLNNFAEQAADMTSSIACVPPGPAGGASTTCTVTCTNNGPGAAVSPLCTITNASSLPGNPAVVCTPNPLPTSLANGGRVSCSVTFNAPNSGSITINGSTGATNDNNGGTNLTGASAGNNPSSAQINIVPADMRPAFSNLPVAVGPGTLYTGLVLTCSNVGSSTATAATCAPTANAGTVSNVVCVAPTPVNVVTGGNIRCTFDYTAPPARGGAPTPETSIDFFGRTTASNDSVGGSDTTVCAVNPVAPNNNCVTANVPVVDAIDDALSTQQFATTGSTNYPLLANDQVGTTTGPAIAVGGVSVPTITGVTRNATTVTNPFAIDPATGALVVPNNTPPGTYVVTYQICANGTTNACDTAVKTVTIEASDMTSTIVCTPNGTAAGAPISCTLTCTNNGPNAAINQTCGFSAGLPAGTAVTCAPTLPAATVGVGGTIVCTTSSFPTPSTPTQILGGTGAENDSNGGSTPAAGNNPAQVQVGAPPAQVPVMNAVGLGALTLMLLAAAGRSRRRMTR
jgi:uncharacterized repeat protein (TIGR01451 family)